MLSGKVIVVNGVRDLWWEGFVERWVLNVKWKSKGVMCDENGDSDDDEPAYINGCW